MITSIGYDVRKASLGSMPSMYGYRVLRFVIMLHLQKGLIFGRWLLQLRKIVQK
jgi:hypothetical protein